MTSADFYYYKTIDSTNSEARRKINEGLSLPAVFIADEQTEGRGRRGKSFFSRGGLYMSVAVDTKESDTVLITTLAAVAVAEAIEEAAGVRAGIKWVNDIYLDGKKICGILCEAISDLFGKTDAVIIGIGVNLNVNDFPEELEYIAGSLSSPTLKNEALAETIAEKLLANLGETSDIIPRYKERSIVLGKTVTYEQNGKTFTGEAVDIDDRGGLVVIDPDGRKTVLSSGEITLRTK